MLRVMIAEDHSLVRDGLRLLLSAQPDMQVVADTSDGREIAPLVLGLRPDLLLLDLGLPGMDGLEVLNTLRQANSTTRILVVTARLDAFSARHSIALGAAGYLPKSEDSAVLLAAMRRVAAGETWNSPDIAALFEAPLTHQTQYLTPREKEVLALVGKGFSSKEIARQFCISDLTVRKHRENICQKLGARNAAELIAIAARISR